MSGREGGGQGHVRNNAKHLRGLRMFMLIGRRLRRADSPAKGLNDSTIRRARYQNRYEMRCTTRKGAFVKEHYFLYKSILDTSAASSIYLGSMPTFARCVIRRLLVVTGVLSFEYVRLDISMDVAR